MKIKTDKKTESLEVNKLLSPTTFFLLFLCVIFSPVMAADRFSPTSVNAGLNNFEKRLNSNQLNVSYILARVLNQARIVEREGDNFRKTAEIFRNNNNSYDSAVSNSVVIPPGTQADQIIVINQNDGDSYAIHR